MIIYIDYFINQNCEMRFSNEFSNLTLNASKIERHNILHFARKKIFFSYFLDRIFCRTFIKFDIANAFWLSRYQWLNSLIFLFFFVFYNIYCCNVKVRISTFFYCFIVFLFHNTWSNFCILRLIKILVKLIAR